MKTGGKRHRKQPLIGGKENGGERHGGIAAAIISVPAPLWRRLAAK